jgi:hypothetical protein
MARKGQQTACQARDQLRFAHTDSELVGRSPVFRTSADIQALGVGGRAFCSGHPETGAVAMRRFSRWKKKWPGPGSSGGGNDCRGLAALNRARTCTKHTWRTRWQSYPSKDAPLACTQDQSQEARHGMRRSAMACSSLVACYCTQCPRVCFATAAEVSASSAAICVGGLGDPLDP